MTKFISDKQEHQTRQKQEEKQKLIYYVWNKNWTSMSASSPRISSSQQGFAPCSILDRFVQWSRHLEKNHTKLTNASSKNYYLVLKKKK
jgi:hypothetical protein